MVPITCRAGETFTQHVAVNVMAGTWNLAGGEHLDQLTPTMLQQWLIEPSEKHGQIADIIVCGFQETVDLTAANMLSTDPRNKMQLELLLTQVFFTWA